MCDQIASKGYLVLDKPKNEYEIVKKQNNKTEHFLLNLFSFLFGFFINFYNNQYSLPPPLTFAIMKYIKHNGRFHELISLYKRRISYEGLGISNFMLLPWRIRRAQILCWQNRNRHSLAFNFRLLWNRCFS